MPSSRGSSPPRDRTRISYISCTGSQVLYTSATWEAQSTDSYIKKNAHHYLPLLTAAESLQSFPTLCDPIDGSPPGSPVPGILQARTLEWVAISFSNAWKWKVKVKLSRVWLFATQWTEAYQAPPSMGFSRKRVLEWVATAFSRC